MTVTWLLLSNLLLGAPLTLSEALSTAEAHQPALVRANAELKAAEARVDEARAARKGSASLSGQTSLSPELQGGSDLTTSSTGTPDGISSSAPFAQSISVQGSLPLYDSGRISASIDSATSLRDAQVATTTLAREEALLEVVVAFFSLREKQQLLTVAATTLQNESEHLAQVTALVEVGTRPQVDLAQARLAFSNARLEVVRAQNARDAARARLILTLGFRPEGPLEVADEALPPLQEESLPLALLVDIALKQREELKALEEQVEASQHQRRLTRAELLPSLEGSVGLSEQTHSSSGWSTGGFAALSLRWTFLDGGASAARVRQIDAEIEALQAALEVKRQAIAAEVEEALLEVSGAQSTLEATQESVKNARERLRLAEGRYTHGMGTLLEVSDAQVALTEAMSGEVQGRYELSAARATLTRALGKSLTSLAGL